MAQIEKVTDVLTEILSEGYEVNFRAEDYLGTGAVIITVLNCKDGNKVKVSQRISTHDFLYLHLPLNELFHKTKALKNELRTNP